MASPVQTLTTSTWCFVEAPRWRDVHSCHTAAGETSVAFSATTLFESQNCAHSRPQVTGHFDGGLRLWDARSGRRAAEVAGLHDSKSGGVCALAAGSLGGESVVGNPSLQLLMGVTGGNPVMTTA